MKSLNIQLIESHLGDIDELLLNLAESFEDSAEEADVREVVDEIEEHTTEIRRYLN